jgi:hypothetical protein
MKYLVLLIDGMRSDQISPNNTPSIDAIAKSSAGVIPLVKSAPFCERSEFYSGQVADKTGNYYAFQYNSNKSPYKKIAGRPWYRLYLQYNNTIRLMSKIFFESQFLDRVNRRSRKYFLKKLVSYGTILYDPNSIPAPFLTKFYLSEDEKPPKDLFEKYPTSLHNICLRLGLTVFDAFENLRVEREYKSTISNYTKITAAIKNDRSDVYLYANSKLDAWEHMHGFDMRVSKVLSEIDQEVEKLAATFLEKYPDGEITVFSPHGMIKITDYVDVEPIIKELQISEEQQLTYFVDSTSVRIWGSHLTEIRNKMNSHDIWNSNGEIIESEIIGESSENMILWVANLGVCCFPDFFRRIRKPLAMHGYWKSNSKLEGFAILPENRNRLKLNSSGALKLSDVVTTIIKD